MAAQSNEPERRRGKQRSKPVKPGRMPVSEFAFDRAGAASPFGDDVIFPLPVDKLTYQHPADEADEPDEHRPEH